LNGRDLNFIAIYILFWQGYRQYTKAKVAHLRDYHFEYKHVPNNAHHLDLGKVFSMRHHSNYYRF